MKKLILIAAVILLAGCATTSSRRMPAHVGASDFLGIDDFCSKYNAQYSFDTVDDIIKISSNYKEMRLLLNSLVAYFDGAQIQLQNPPWYKDGKIYVPREIERIMFSQEAGMLPSTYLVKTVVIDPGHGGKDPGTISQGGFKEKDLNLSVAKHLEKELKSKGFKVILTRNQDKFISLEQRVNIARSHNADLFIAVHGNANRKRFMKGIEIYYLSPARFDSQKRSSSLAQNSGPWLRRPSAVAPDARAILWDLVLTKNYSLSVDAAYVFYSTFRNLEFAVKSPRVAPFYVLRNAYVPSILVEVGYLSNRYEEKMLKREYYQQQIAEAISMGVAALNQRHSPLALRGDSR